MAVEERVSDDADATGEIPVSMPLSVVVREATAEDLPAVFAMRDAYYAARNAPVQVRDGIVWLVAEYEGRIVACEGYRDTSATQREQTDFYRTPDRFGKMGAMRLMEQVHAFADYDRVTLWGHTEPDNLTNLQAALAKGWKIGGVLIYREPEAICQPQSL